MTRSIHVVLKKEDIMSNQLTGKIAVVFDILLATSTMATILQEGGTSVIPVVNWQEAKEVSTRHPRSSILLAGEYKGRTLAGFLAPFPSELKKEVKDKLVILSTTNGTVAINHSSQAKRLYAASLLNAQAVGQEILTNYNNETIVLICSGSQGAFCLEDFYGAGYMIHCLLKHQSFRLTDAAKAAYLCYKSAEEDAYHMLCQSRLGKKLIQYNYENEVSFVAQKSIYPVVPCWERGKIVNINN